MRLGFLTTAEGAIAAIGPVLAGLLVAGVGFYPLFAVVLGALIISLAILIWRVREPRGRDQSGSVPHSSTGASSPLDKTEA